MYDMKSFDSENDELNSLNARVSARINAARICEIEKIAFSEHRERVRQEKKHKKELRGLAAFVAVIVLFIAAVICVCGALAQQVDAVPALLIVAFLFACCLWIMRKVGWLR